MVELDGSDEASLCSLILGDSHCLIVFAVDQDGAGFLVAAPVTRPAGKEPEHRESQPESQRHENAVAPQVPVDPARAGYDGAREGAAEEPTHRGDGDDREPLHDRRCLRSEG